MGRPKPFDLEVSLDRNHLRVYRIAVALCGGRKAGMAVFRKVLATSGVMFDRWEDQTEAERWFLRYTVLCSRSHSPKGSKGDALFEIAAVPPWQAMVIAIRNLPQQQREALLLSFGEQLEARQLATAMDCSSTAAKNHLSAAIDSIQQIYGGGLGEFTRALPGLMNQLVPPPGTLEVEINRVIHRRRRKRWVRRLVLTGFALALLTWTVWKTWKMGLL